MATFRRRRRRRRKVKKSRRRHKRPRRKSRRGRKSRRRPRRRSMGRRRRGGDKARPEETIKRRIIQVFKDNESVVSKALSSLPGPSPSIASIIKTLEDTGAKKIAAVNNFYERVYPLGNIARSFQRGGNGEEKHPHGQPAAAAGAAAAPAAAGGESKVKPVKRAFSELDKFLTDNKFEQKTMNALAELGFKTVAALITFATAEGYYGSPLSEKLDVEELHKLKGVLEKQQKTVQEEKTRQELLDPGTAPVYSDCMQSCLRKARVVASGLTAAAGAAVYAAAPVGAAGSAAAGLGSALGAAGAAIGPQGAWAALAALAAGIWSVGDHIMTIISASHLTVIVASSAAIMWSACSCAAEVTVSHPTTGSVWERVPGCPEWKSGTNPATGKTWEGKCSTKQERKAFLIELIKGMYSVVGAEFDLEAGSQLDNLINEYIIGKNVEAHASKA